MGMDFVRWRRRKPLRAVLPGCSELAFPGFEFSWMLPEFEDSLKLELDFRQEARNGERVAAMFAAQPDVHVPAVLHNLTSRRLLTMEYVNGVKPTDKQGLAGLGVEPKQV